MEPASVYLVCLIATFGLWILGGRTWALALWIDARVSAFPLRRTGSSRLGSLLLGVVVAATLWRVAPAAADVVPVRDRTVVSVEVQPVEVVTSDPGRGTPVDSALSRYTPLFDRIDSGRSSEARTHTVVRGDCLWKIARGALIADGVNPSGAAVGDLWRRIYAENREVVGDDPNLIFPGQVLSIPER